MSPLVPVTLPWSEILKRTFKAAYDDNCLGLAAQLAYYFFLALFPALLFLLAIASLFPFELMQDLMNSLALVAPPDVLSIIRDQLTKIATGDDRGILTIGIVGAVWSSSAALGAMIDAMNRAYDVHGVAPVVESAADRHRADDRAGRLHPGVVAAGAGRTDGGRVARTPRRLWCRLRVGLEDPAVAAGGAADDDRHRDRELRRAGRSAGVAVDDSGLGLRHDPLAA